MLMRKFTCVLIAGAMAGTLPATATMRNAFGVQTKAGARGQKEVSAPKSKKEAMDMARAAATENPIWRAGSETVYGWDGDEWQFEEQYAIEYDEAGRKTKEIMVDYEDFYHRTTYTYDANGMITCELVEESEDGENYVNHSKKERTYDPVVTNLITSNREYMWIGGNWMLGGNNYNRNITRNADGNVTLTEIAVWYDGAYDPTNRITVTYGDDGKATTIKETVLTYDGIEFKWADGDELANITWDRTDGQIVSTEGFGLGANRMKSCDEISDGDLIHSELTYDGENFTAVMTGEIDGDKVEGTVVYEVLDDFGSYSQTSTQTYHENGETYTEVETYVLRNDSYGNMLESRNAVVYDDGYEEIFEDITGTVEYDDTYGYPLVYSVAMGYYDEMLDDYVKENMIKMEYSDYKDVTTGVGGIGADPATADTVYYTLQGVKTSNPVKGNIYIVKKGGKATKAVF